MRQRYGWKVWGLNVQRDGRTFSPPATIRRVRSYLTRRAAYDAAQRLADEYRWPIAVWHLTAGHDTIEPTPIGDPR